MSGHGHKMTTPGELGSGHRGDHIPHDKVPKKYQKIPNNLNYSTPIGGQ